MLGKGDFDEQLSFVSVAICEIKLSGATHFCWKKYKPLMVLVDRVCGYVANVFQYAQVHECH